MCLYAEVVLLFGLLVVRACDARDGPCFLSPDLV